MKKFLALLLALTMALALVACGGNSNSRRWRGGCQRYPCRQRR